MAKLGALPGMREIGVTIERRKGGPQPPVQGEALDGGPSTRTGAGDESIYSAWASSAALPPAAAVLIDSVRSTAKRNR